MTNVFDNYLLKEPIFKDENCLKTACLPPDLLHRDEHLQVLSSYLVEALKGQKPTNVMINGSAGIGKTALIRYFGREFGRKADEIDKPAEVVYVDGNKLTTTYRVLQHVANHFIGDWKERVPPTGWLLDDVVGKLNESLRGKLRPTMIALDHVEGMGDADEVVNILAEAKSDTGRGDIALVGAGRESSYSMDSMERHDFERLRLPGYSEGGLRDIFNYHANIAFANGVTYSDAVEQTLAQLAEESSHNLGRGMNLLHQAGKITQDMRLRNVSAESVKKALEDLSRNDLSNILATLPRHHKYSVIGMAHLLGLNGKTMTTGKAYEAYSCVAASAGDRPIGQRYFSNILTEVGQAGILRGHDRTISHGRYGRTREVSLKFNEKAVIDELLVQDPLLLDLINSSRREVLKKFRLL